MIATDYFAELYVAGRFADEGWNVYFPHRDKGFDFVIAKTLRTGEELIRPVQVKGKYPTEGKTDKMVYGYVGKLTQTHPEMVLAIPFFSLTSQRVPCCVAYLPVGIVKPHTRGYRCEPTTFKNGVPIPRPAYSKFFDERGLLMLESVTWRNSVVSDKTTGGG